MAGISSGIGGSVGGQSEVGATGPLRQDRTAGGISQPDYIAGGRRLEQQRDGRSAGHVASHGDRLAQAL